MLRQGKFKVFRSVSRKWLGTVTLLVFAALPLTPRNTLHAADPAGDAAYTVAQLDSLFRTVYFQDENPFKGSGWKPFQRFSWFYGQRAGASGDIPAGARMQAWQEKQQRPRLPGLDENWTSIGPSNLAGRILCTEWHPTNSNIIYAGSASGGLWKTTNGGANWFPLTDALPSLAVGAIALQPGNPDVIYIGTGEGSFNADAVYGAGIFKSTDGGATWNATGLSWNQSQSRAINKIVINPTNTQILYAAANRNVGGVFKSTNGGTSWTQYHTGDVKDLVQHPDSVNVLYCVNGDPWGNNANGVYRSTDSGVTWTRLSNGLPSATSMGRAHITMSPSNRQTMYLGVSQTLSGGAGLLGIYKTTNAGASWTLQATEPNFYSGQGWYNLVIRVHPTNPAIVYSSGIDCYKSTDSGVTWTRKTVWSYPPTHSQYAHADHHDLIFQPGNANTILVATDGGIYKSINSGDTWSGLNNGLTTYQFYAIGQDVLSPSVLYGGTQDNGTNKYTGTGSWTWVLSGDGGYCNVDYTNSNIVYAETQRGTHYKSTNAGSSWNMIQTGINGYGAWATPVAMDPTNPACLYTATTQIYKTTNGGTNWTAISNSLAPTYVTTIAVAPSNPSVIYAGCGGGGVVWKTTNGGTDWTNITSGLPNEYVTRVAVHPTNPGTVYASMSTYASGRVFRSTNGGATWTNASTGLPFIPCNALVVDPANPSTIYAGTDLGVYRSTDSGTSWSDFSAGLPNVVVHDLALHPTTGVLRAGTHGRGAWETAVGSAANIVVLTPNGGDTWPTGTTQTVTWGTGGLGGNVRIELNRNYPAGTWEVLLASTPNDGSQSWAVSGATTTAARVRITSVETPAATDISNANFSITGAVISLIRPNGGETLTIGSVDTIAWTVTGTPGTYVVQLNRSYPSGTWTTLTTTTNLSTQFAVSGPATSTARVRVYLQSNPATGDTSDANFSIADPTITVISPNGGETYTPGQTVMLRWTSAHVTGSKRVEINRNYPSGTWETLTPSVAADSMGWTVTQTGSSAARIRVTSNLYPAATDISNANFTILTPTLAVVAPNGGETWPIGATRTIRWTRSNLVGLVNVHYNPAYPEGQWVTVALNQSADSLQWVVPGPVSGSARVRVTSVNLPTFRDESNANFTIGSGITVSSPNGGENWSLTGLANITWTRANATGNATVQLNRSYPVGAWETLTTTAAGDNYVWTISGATTSAARVRVFLTSNPTVGDTSNASFSIVVSTLTVTSPNGGETWNTGRYVTTRWTRSNASGPVSVLLNRNYPAGSWDTLATAVTADTLRWWLPNTGWLTQNARVRVVWDQVPQISDISNANFTITPTLVVLSPNGGEVWPLNSTQIIRWRRSNYTGPVRVLMTRTFPNGGGWDGWYYLSSAAMGDSLVYTLPDYGPTASARIIVSEADMTFHDTSDANFSVVPATSITVTAPNGGEQWALGTPQTITFVRSNAAGAATVQLNRNYPGGSWETLNSNVTGSSLGWTPSGAASSNARVRVYLNSNQAIRDSSNANFSIVSGGSSLVLTVPNGGETWVTGSTQVVRFTRSNAAGNVAVLLNRSYPSGSWETLASTVTADTFAWNVSGATSTAARVRVYLASNPSVGDTSAGNFSIVAPMITVIAPNGGESWAIGSTQTISFTRSNATGNATVEVNRSYPAGAWEVLSTAVGGSTFSWTVSGAATSTARVRVSLTSTPSVTDISNANFSLTSAPTLTLSAPNGGDVWSVGTTQVVRFTRENAAGNVVVQLNRTYPGGAWEVLSSTVAVDTFAWAVSGATSSSSRVRIYLASNTSVGDTSAANFLIVMPTLTVTSPNGGESWTVGTNQTISFTRSYAIGSATVQINRAYPDGIWETLTNAVIGSSYTWTVTSPATSSARIRVFLNSQPAVADTSNANFAVAAQPSLTLFVPNGGETWPVGSTQVIRWSRTNAAGNVVVMLNRAFPTGSWELLTGIAAADTFAWTVSGAASSAARVRIYLSGNSSVGDTSAANFAIAGSAITVTVPNGGEAWNIGTGYTISFTRSNASGAATVELNRNYPSATWEVINNNVTGSSLTWAPAGTPTANARIRVYLNATPSLGDTSDANFSLLGPGITVVAPNGGDTLYTGEIYPITWTRNNAAGAVTVAINRNYPSATWEVLTTLPTGTSYSWTVTGGATANARIRVTLNSNPAVGDTSDANFRVATRQLVVVQPNGGETYAIGSLMTVTWERYYASGFVTVALNRSYPLGTWETLTTNALGESFLWTVNGEESSTARVRVYLTANSAVYDVSNANFAIGSGAPAGLVLSSPNGGETYALNGPMPVRWSRNGTSGSVLVYLNRAFPSGSWELLGASSTDSLVWTAAGNATSAARVRIVLQSNSAIGDTSAANFSIVGAAQLTVVVPNGGEQFLSGFSYYLTISRLNHPGPVTIQINRSYPSGAWQNVVTGFTGDSHLWVASAPYTDNARIRVFSEANPALGDTSNANFRIVPFGLLIISPDVGDTVSIGQPLTLRWARQQVGPVDVLINRAYPNGQWEILGDDIDSDSLLWTVTPPATQACRFAVHEHADSLVADTTDGNIAIAAVTLEVTHPQGGEVFTEGQAVNITWSKEFAFSSGNVLVQLNRDYPGGAWETVASDINGNGATWVADSNVFEHGRVKVSLMDNPGVWDISNGDFRTERQALTLLTPNGGETLAIGHSTTIRWRRLGITGAVRVQINRNYPSGAWQLITDNAIGDSLAWTVNGLPSSAVRFKVTLASDLTITDVGDGNCAIMPPLFFTDPVAEGADTIAHTRTLAWGWAAGGGNVRLTLSRNGTNGPWELIAGSVPGTSYNWQVTGPPSNNVRYRVTSLSDTTVYVVSVPRSIVAEQLAIQDPGGGTWFIGEQRWVRWTRSNFDGPVNLELQRMDRSQPWEAIAQTTSDSILWTVTGPATEFAMLRLSAASDPNVFDTTDVPMRIGLPHVTVVAPNGSEYLEEGSSIRLRWVGEGFEGPVSIRLWRGNPVNRLDTLFVSTPNDSDEIWTITGPTAVSCYLLVRSVQNPSLWDTSDARFVISGPTSAPELSGETPREYSLDVPYPNPFNSRTVIPFALPKSGHVQVTIFDMLGREVARLVDGPRAAGLHSVGWDAANAATGIYIVRMTSPDFVATRKLHLIK